MPVKNSIASWQADLTEWRRHIHTHPELRFEEHQTAAFVAEKLRMFGVDEVHEGIGRTGVVGVIRGRGQGSGRVLAFRADMDALPITEATGVGHASVHPGVMHACGHDGHTTMLLGAARYLAETRSFDGTVVLLFQPAEEGGGGARAMVEEGVMDRFGVHEVYGMHNWPGLPAGQFATRPGPLMAAADFFELDILGKGGHGAKPHLAVDASLAAAQVVCALQMIAARNIDPVDTVVVSVCGMRSDSFVHNVLPDKVTLVGTTRFFDVANRAVVKRRLQEIAEATARAHGAEAVLRYIPGVEPTVNAPDQTAHAIRAAEAVADGVMTNKPPTMGGEDFADMLAVRPGAFMFIGNGDSADLHNPGYDFNDAALASGSSWFATLAEQRMPLT
jgi:hippurate hydrolase